MHNIDTYDFAGKRALIRVDFNVPQKENTVTDDTRIKAAIPTIKKVLEKGGSVILMSHLGRPKNGFEDKFSLKYILKSVEDNLGSRVIFAGDCISDQAAQVCESLKPGDVALLDNLRFHEEETKGDEFFAGRLAGLGDVYINDAFGTAHREHASTAVIAKFFPHDKMFGYVMEKEIHNIDKLLHNPEKPVLAIVGGAKVSSKINIIENLLSRVQELIIGGGMTYTFIRARGGQTGNSLVEEEQLEIAKDLFTKAAEKGVRIHLPKDTVIADDFSNDASTDVCNIDVIPDGWMGLDIGPETIEEFTSRILEAKTILWNGPMGVFEMSKFELGTKAIAHALAKATENGAFTLIGGGDSVAAINKYDLAHQVSYVSTGGGAMLEYLEGITLPGIKAIRE